MFQSPQPDPFPGLAGPFTRDELTRQLAADPDIRPIGEPIDIDPGRTFLVNVLDNRTHDAWGIIYVPGEQADTYIRADWLPARRP